MTISFCDIMGLEKGRTALVCVVVDETDSGLSVEGQMPASDDALIAALTLVSEAQSRGPVKL